MKYYDKVSLLTYISNCQYLSIYISIYISTFLSNYLSIFLGGVHLLGYIIEKRISSSESWERVQTVESSCRQTTVENLKVHKMITIYIIVTNKSRT